MVAPLQPFLDTEYGCVAVMMMPGVLTPRWFQVKCDDVIMNTVFCENPHRRLVHQSQTPTLIACPENFIRINQSCFAFLWGKMNTRLKEETPKKHRMISSGQLAAVLESLQTYTGLHNSLHLNHPNKDIKVQVAKQTKIHVGMEYFLCQKNVHISVSLFCDGKSDCPGNDTSDEEHCFCSEDKHSTICKYVFAEGKRACSKWFYMTPRGECALHVLPANRRHFLPAENPFKCCSGAAVPAMLQNDLVSDCGMHAEDEKFTLSDELSRNSSKCTFEGQFSCRQSEVVCFSVSELCVFTLNEFGTLAPCRTGEHLKQCRLFQCNKMFKCPDFYCLPWHYVCNGQWDCPSGLDEGESCGSRICSHLLKCQHSQLCVHMGHVCDGIQDCPHNDDEVLCRRKGTQCPVSCHCLGTTLWCSDSFLDDLLQVDKAAAFSAVFVKNCIFEEPSNIAKFTSAVQLKINNCGLGTIGRYIKNIAPILFLDLSNNKILSLESEAFPSLLMWISLRENKISTIHRSAFIGLHFLSYLDLSENLLETLQEELFKYLIELQVLIFDQHAGILETIDGSVLDQTPLKLLKTEQFGLCCFIPDDAHCQSENPWYKPCDDLLPTVAVKWTFYSVSSGILFCNIISLVSQVSAFVMRKSRSAAFPVSVLSVNVAHISCALYLCLLWLSDLYFGDTFPWYEDTFLSSYTCLSAFGSALLFLSLSPLILLFISLARAMVVIHPFHTRFKSAIFVIRCLSAMCFFVLFFVISVTLVTKFYDAKSSSPLCFPTIDPSDRSIVVKALTWFLLVFHCVAAAGIIFTDLCLVKELKLAQQKLAGSVSKKISHEFLFAQLGILSGSSVACWIPSDVVYVTLLLLKSYPCSLAIWTIVGVNTVNSFVHPVTFTLKTTRKIFK